MKLKETTNFKLNIMSKEVESMKGGIKWEGVRQRRKKRNKLKL